MANVGGPRSSKRRLLMSAVQSVLLYGAEVWADALTKECYRLRLARVQRQVALRVCSAYRTVSEPAVLVVAGVIPVKLLAGERKAIYQRQGEIGKDAARSEERARTFQQWQHSWEHETRGRWTARLIEQVQPCVERQHGEMDYYLTQFLTGHGYFKSYLNRMGKTGSPDCIYCPGVPDDAEHTFFRCPRWETPRLEATRKLGVFSVDTICEKIMEDEGNWDCLSQFVRGILLGKKPDLDREVAQIP
uniref:Reverse transcriptase zinc-binding domain-containing protein n=1 Tax=Homalodisca liturata TaxID=320908 RepID=A0A1B6J232_9HEMI